MITIIGGLAYLFLIKPLEDTPIGVVIGTFALAFFIEHHPKKKPQFHDILEKKVDPNYTLTDHLWNYLQNYAKKPGMKLLTG